MRKTIAESLDLMRCSVLFIAIIIFLLVVQECAGGDKVGEPKENPERSLGSRF